MAELIEDLFASFVRDLKATGRSPRTVKVYTDSMHSFTGWLEGNGRPLTDESLTKHAIATWLGELGERLSPGTVTTYYKGMRRFVLWLVAEGEITENPFKNLSQPTPPLVPVPIIKDEDVIKLLQACNGKTFTDRRDEAIIRVLFDCGVRIAELAGLTVDDVDMKSDVIVVLGKGSKLRAIPFGAKTARALDRYIRMRRQHKHAAEDGFWLGQRGAYKPDGIDNLLRVRAEQAGVEDLHAHRFRHTAAHDWLVAGGQERDLMRLMGWTSDAMLDRYGASAAVERAHAASRKLKRGDRL